MLNRKAQWSMGPGRNLHCMQRAQAHSAEQMVRIKAGAGAFCDHAPNGASPCGSLISCLLFLLLSPLHRAPIKRYQGRGAVVRGPDGACFALVEVTEGLGIKSGF